MKTSLFTAIFAFGHICALRAQIAEIPFQLYGNHIFIEVKMNGGRVPGVFIFDTGASSTVLDSTFALDHGIRPDHEQQATGAGGSKTYKMVLGQSLTLEPGILIEDIRFLLADLSDLKKSTGKAFAGIIGYDILKDYITKVDFDRNRILLYRDIAFADTASCSVIPFKFLNGITIPQFNAKIQLKNGEWFEGPVFFDSGAGLTLLMNTPFKEQNRIEEKAGKTIHKTHKSLTTRSSSRTAAISALQIGPYTFGAMPIGLSADREGVSAFSGYLGILGMSIIKRFNIIVDCRAKKLYLRPNKMFADNFDFPLSGIDLSKEGDEIYIERVAENSPAEKLGLKNGQRIVSVEDYEGRDLEKIREFLKKEGREVKITVQEPGGKKSTFRLKLERLL